MREDNKFIILQHLPDDFMLFSYWRGEGISSTDHITDWENTVKKTYFQIDFIDDIWVVKILNSNLILVRSYYSLMDLWDKIDLQVLEEYFYSISGVRDE